LVLTVEIFVRLQELGFHKPSLPPVPEDAVDRAARRVAAEKKEKKDAKKARARERMRARDALERRLRKQERDGLPREPSPETPDDDDWKSPRGGVNRAKLKFTKLITTTSRVSVRNIIESAREGEKQIASK
jgi:hypothetical protein